MLKIPLSTATTTAAPIPTRGSRYGLRRFPNAINFKFSQVIYWRRLAICAFFTSFALITNHSFSSLRIVCRLTDMKSSRTAINHFPLRRWLSTFPGISISSIFIEITGKLIRLCSSSSPALRRRTSTLISILPLLPILPIKSVPTDNRTMLDLQPRRVKCPDCKRRRSGGWRSIVCTRPVNRQSAQHGWRFDVTGNHRFVGVFIFMVGGQRIIVATNQPYRAMRYQFCRILIHISSRAPVRRIIAPINADPFDKRHLPQILALRNQHIRNALPLRERNPLLDRWNWLLGRQTSIPICRRARVCTDKNDLSQHAVHPVAVAVYAIKVRQIGRRTLATVLLKILPWTDLIAFRTADAAYVVLANSGVIMSRRNIAVRALHAFHALAGALITIRCFPLTCFRARNHNPGISIGIACIGGINQLRQFIVLRTSAQKQQSYSKNENPMPSSGSYFHTFISFGRRRSGFHRILV